MLSNAIPSIVLAAVFLNNVHAEEASMIPLETGATYAGWHSYSFFDEENNALTVGTNTMASDMTGGANVFCFLTNETQSLYMAVISDVYPKWGSAEVAVMLTIDDNFPEPFKTTTFGNEAFILLDDITPIINQMIRGETLLIQMFGKGENGRTMDIVVSLMGFTKASTAALTQCDEL